MTWSADDMRFALVLGPPSLSTKLPLKLASVACDLKLASAASVALDLRLVMVESVP